MGNTFDCLSNSHEESSHEPNDENETSTEHQNRHLETHTIVDESMSGTIASLQRSAIDSDVIVSDESCSGLPTRGVQHLFRESTKNVEIKNPQIVHIGDEINCHGSVEFFNSSQSNVKITNEQYTSLRHDFGKI